MLFKNKEVIDEEGKKVVNQIRALSIDMIHLAGGGHPGITLGCAPILYTLYSKHMKINPNDPMWVNRDRFVLSAGHASALLYATLYLCGYDITLDDLKNFRRIDSNLPGHPEYGQTPGVEASTGVLGEGVGMAVGMALGEEYLRKTFKENGECPIDYYTYCLASDGDLMEGVSYEALSFAGTQKLNKLIIIYDNNKTTIDGDTSLTFTENVSLRMEALGFSVIEVLDGEDLNAIDKAIEKAKNSDKPSFISVNTTIGKYSKYEGTNKIHGGDLDLDDISKMKEKFNLRDIPFAISSEIHEYFKQEVLDRCMDIYNSYMKSVDEYLEHPLYNRLVEHNYKISSSTIAVNMDNINDNVSLREISGNILSSIDNPLLIGGSCDLFASIKNYQVGKGDFSIKARNGRNIWFGVREHASGAIINGLLLSGLRAYTSTFLTFSDHLKPSIRMSAMMNLPAIYIFSHDSIRVGEDGPTHQAVEQLDSLRLIPNVEVFRPADTNEIIGTYKAILAKNSGVSIIVLPRDSVNNIQTTSINEVMNGGYIVSREEGRLNNILIASGEDLQVALDVKKRLQVKGINVRVVSMPSTNRFDKMDDEYKNDILPKNVRKIAIESSTALTFLKYVNDTSNLINITAFGFSGGRDDVLNKMHFDTDSIEKLIS